MFLRNLATFVIKSYLESDQHLKKLDSIQAIQ